MHYERDDEGESAAAGGSTGQKRAHNHAGVSTTRPMAGAISGGDDVGVIGLSHVAVAPRPVAQLEPVIGAERFGRLVAVAAQIRARLAGRAVWNVNSTAVGGGVAEMLQALCGYVSDLGIDIRWSVIGGDPAFFALTKRLHNRIHGQLGDGGELGPSEAAHYAEVTAANATELLQVVRRGDLVLLHDPQTAGLVEPLAAAGAEVVWRCHIGIDEQNDLSRSAWDFLRPFLEAAHAFVFSRPQYAPEWVPAEARWIIPPSIDPFSAKNQPLEPATVRAILARIGVLDSGHPDAPTGFIRCDGTVGEVVRPATIVADGPLKADDRYVLQVSRWDRLKDMAGVMRGFAEHTAPVGPGSLILAGPAVAGVTDDPEGAEVYRECLAQWEALPAPIRGRVLLVTLPLEDVDENAAMVNALQRQAAVITQKSLAEGFGLTVAEGMWKGRPLAASAVGGIQDQIVDGTGVLLPDPTDLATFGAVLRELLDRPDLAERIGAAAKAYVAAHFVGDLHLLRYAGLLATLLADEP
jgi:trehalose synthase